MQDAAILAPGLFNEVKATAVFKQGLPGVSGVFECVLRDDELLAALAAGGQSLHTKGKPLPCLNKKFSIVAHIVDNSSIDQSFPKLLIF